MAISQKLLLLLWARPQRLKYMRFRQIFEKIFASRSTIRKVRTQTLTNTHPFWWPERRSAKAKAGLVVWPSYRLNGLYGLCGSIGRSTGSDRTHSVVGSDSRVSATVNNWVLVCPSDCLSVMRCTEQWCALTLTLSATERSAGEHQRCLERQMRHTSRKSGISCVVVLRESSQSPSQSLSERRSHASTVLKGTNDNNSYSKASAESVRSRCYRLCCTVKCSQTNTLLELRLRPRV